MHSEHSYDHVQTEKLFFGGGDVVAYVLTHMGTIGKNSHESAGLQNFLDNPILEQANKHSRKLYTN